MGLFKNAAKDAKEIQEKVDYRILRAAWDGYVRIKKTGFQGAHRTATPAWFALFAIQNYEGKFDKFDKDELHLLQALSHTAQAYDEIISELQEHESDGHLAEYIFSTHPDLHQAVPEEYDNEADLNRYIADVVTTYRDLLQRFYKRYRNEIDKAVEKLQK